MCVQTLKKQWFPAWAMAGLGLLWTAPPAAAQGLRDVPGMGASGGRSPAVPAASAGGEGHDAIARDRLLPLLAAEEQLARARARSGELDDRGALAALARAQASVRQALDVPGVVALAAEIELQLGVAAAQAGQMELAEASVRRAVRLDPGRKLLAGEASPALVQLADRVAREAAAAPSGELRVEVDAPGARVFLDDELQGDAPLTLRALVGGHVLRVEAPGHAPYAALFPLLEGKRPALRVVLSPDRPTATGPSTTRAVCEGARCGEQALVEQPGRAEAVSSPWRRWYVWAALSAVALGAGALAIVLATPAPERQLRVVVDPADLR